MCSVPAQDSTLQGGQALLPPTLLSPVPCNLLLLFSPLSLTVFPCLGSNYSLSFDLGLSWILINNLPPFHFLSWLFTLSSPALFRFLFWYSLSSLHCSHNFVFLHFPDAGFPLLFLSTSDSCFQAVSPGFLPHLNVWLLSLAFLATFALNLC